MRLYVCNRCLWKLNSCCCRLPLSCFPGRQRDPLREAGVAPTPPISLQPWSVSWRSLSPRRALAGATFCLVDTFWGVFSSPASRMIYSPGKVLCEPPPESPSAHPTAAPTNHSPGRQRESNNAGRLSDTSKVPRFHPAASSSSPPFPPNQFCQIQREFPNPSLCERVFNQALISRGHGKHGCCILPSILPKLRGKQGMTTFFIIELSVPLWLSAELFICFSPCPFSSLSQPISPDSCCLSFPFILFIYTKGKLNLKIFYFFLIHPPNILLLFWVSSGSPKMN